MEKTEGASAEVADAPTTQDVARTSSLPDFGSGELGEGVKALTKPVKDLAPLNAGVEQEVAETARNTLNITASQLFWLVDAVRLALVDHNKGPDVFRYGQTFARIGRNDENQPRITVYTKAVFRERISRVTRWVRLGGKNSETELECSPPADVTAAVFDAADLVPGIPPIERVTTAPILGRDGSLVTTAGYHPGSRVWYEASAALEKMPAVPQTPSGDDVAHALALLLDALSEFPFKTQSDRAHALALMLLPFLRSLIIGPVPFQLISSTTPGTGKGKLFNACLFPALGAEVPAESLGETEAEQRKKITANLLQGPTVVRLDNIKVALESAALEGLLTTTVWSDRILGFSEQVQLPNRAIWGATANNPDMKLDMARRTINIVLDADTERPWMRTIERVNLEGWLRDNRAQLVHACLVLCQAWVAQRQPKFSGKPLGSYESWSEVVGGVLEVAGVKGFLSNVSEFYDSVDQTTSQERDFVQEWWNVFQDNPTTIKDLVGVASNFFTDLPFLQPEKGLGKRLRKMINRVYIGDSLRVTFVGGRGTKYKLVQNRTGREV